MAVLMTDITVRLIAQRLHLRMLAGSGDLPVRHVHTIELEDPSEYLQPGELILSNGLWYRRPNQALNYVRRLVRAEVAGLGFGLVNPAQEVPDSMVEACRASNLTLIEIPPGFKFVTISDAVVEQGRLERQAVLERAMERHGRLLAVEAKAGGVGGLVQVLGSELHRDVSVVRQDHVVVAAGRKTVPYGLATGAPSPLPDTRRSMGVGPHEFLVVGHVRLIVGGSAMLGPEERVAIDETLVFLRLDLARARASRELERRLGTELIGLIEAGPHHQPAVDARMLTLGLDPSQSGCVVVAMITHDQYDDPDLELPHQCVIAHGDDCFIILSRPNEVNPIAESLLASPYITAVGIGRLAANSSGLRRSLIEARHAARMALRPLEGRPRLLHHFEVGHHHLLLDLLEPEVLTAFRQSVIGRMIEHDEQHGTELTKSLDTFFGCGRRWGETARCLRVHQNTLRYRLARIEQLTGRRLQSMSDCVDLYLALATKRSSPDGSERPAR